MSAVKLKLSSCWRKRLPPSASVSLCLKRQFDVRAGDIDTQQVFRRGGGGEGWTVRARPFSVFLLVVSECYDPLVRLSRNRAGGFTGTAKRRGHTPLSSFTRTRSAISVFRAALWSRVYFCDSKKKTKPLISYLAASCHLDLCRSGACV